MSQQHWLVSLRVISSHVSSDPSSWLSVSRNPCIVHACVSRLVFMLLQMHLWVGIRSFSGHWSAEDEVVHVGFPADSRASEIESPLPDRLFFVLTIRLLAEITVLLGRKCWGAVFHPANSLPGQNGSRSWFPHQNSLARRPQVSFPVFYSSIVRFVWIFWVKLLFVCC